jgi:hypothetical protein
MYGKLAFLVVGALAGPLVMRVLGPALREVGKGAFWLAYEAKNAVMQMGEDIQDMAAEAAANAGNGSSPTRPTDPKTRVSTRGAD